MIAAAFFDEMAKLAEKENWTKGERLAADLSLLANGVGFGSAGTALWQNRRKGFVEAVRHIPVGSTIANLAGVTLGTGALYHRKKRLEKEKEEQKKHAAAFFDETAKLAEEDDWTPGENAARLTALGLHLGTLGYTGKRLWDHRDKGFAALDYVSPYAQLGNIAGAALGLGAHYHRERRHKREKEGQKKHAASSCHSAYTPKKRSGKPRAPRRVSLLHSAN